MPETHRRRVAGRDAPAILLPWTRPPSPAATRRRRAPGLRPDAGADGGPRPADARRGAGRVAVHGPPGRHAPPRPDLVLWDGEALVVFSKPGAAKVRNLRANPRLMVAVGDPEDDFSVGLIEAEATCLTRGRDPGRVLRQVRGRARARAPRRRRPSARPTRRPIRIVPTRYLQWHGRGEAHDAVARRCRRRRIAAPRVASSPGSRAVVAGSSPGSPPRSRALLAIAVACPGRRLTAGRLATRSTALGGEDGRRRRTGAPRPGRPAMDDLSKMLGSLGGDRRGPAAGRHRRGARRAHRQRGRARGPPGQLQAGRPRRGGAVVGQHRRQRGGRPRPARERARPGQGRTSCPPRPASTSTRCCRCSPPPCRRSSTRSRPTARCRPGDAAGGFDLGSMLEGLAGGGAGRGSSGGLLASRTSGRSWATRSSRATGPAAASASGGACGPR